MEVCHDLLLSHFIWTHLNSLPRIIDWTTLERPRRLLSAMRHCQCENPSLSKMLIDILPKWAGIKMPTLVMSMFWFPALVLQWAWAQLAVSITCGEPACSGMFQRWHCKHDQHLCDTAISVEQIWMCEILQKSYLYLSLSECKPFMSICYMGAAVRLYQEALEALGTVQLLWSCSSCASLSLGYVKSVQ